MPATQLLAAGVEAAHVSRMTLASLLSPIAAATIVNVGLFALMWRGHQEEKRVGKPTWRHEAGMAAYAAAVGVFGWLRLQSPLGHPLDHFGVALAGEAMGVLVVFTLLHGFVISRGQPFKERAFPMLLGIGLAGVAFAGLLVR